MHTCAHELTINARLRQDPSRTGFIQRAYEKDLVARFDALRKLVIKSIVDDDCFCLNKLTGHAAMDPAGKFVFITTPEKVDAFMDWLAEQEDKGILEITERQGRKVIARNAWQDTYIRSTYIRGLEQSSATLERQGVIVGPINQAFYRPWHADSLGILFTRQFSQLRGITEAMDQQISRVLAEGFSQGLGARDIAKKIANRIDSIGIVRARTLARTEVMNAHAESTLNLYEEYGVEVVGLMAEWSTAGDGRVCEACAAHAGKVYTIEEARGLLPFHPNCRCVWLPANVGEKGVQQPTEEEESFVRAKYDKAENLPSFQNDMELTNDPEDLVLKAIYKDQGYDGLPTVLPKAEIDKLVEQGYIEMYRGVTDAKYIEAFKTGDHFAGRGVFGNGTYLQASFGPNVLPAYEFLDDGVRQAVKLAPDHFGVKRAMGVAIDYSGPNGARARVLLRPEARVVRYADAKARMWAESAALDDVAASASASEWASLNRANRLYYQDVGRWASSKGYDAIIAENNEVVLLNRTMAIVQEESITWEEALSVLS